MIVPPIFDRTSSAYDEDFFEGLAQVSLDGRVGFIDAAGKVVIEPAYERAGHFAEALAPVKNDGRWGYLDAGADVVINFAHDWADAFSEGRAAVRNPEQKWGFIDRGGALVVLYQFDSASAYVDGWAAVETNKPAPSSISPGTSECRPRAAEPVGLIDGLARKFQREVRYWEIVLRSDGTAEYIGNEKAKRRGTYMGKVDRIQFRRLAELLQDAGFFELGPSDEALHAAQVITRVTADALAHTVKRDEHAQPVALWGMNHAIIAVADRIDWKRQKAARAKAR